jgi:Tfp pilus assembly protein FimT
MQRLRTTSRRGVLLVDLLVSLAVLGIILLAVIPAVRPEEPMRLIAASTILASDIEFAQSATLATPQDPTIVRFDPDAGHYWLARASEPETPIDRPGGGPYEVIFGSGDAETLIGVTLATESITDDTVTYDAFGRLVQLSNAVVRLSNDAGDIVVSVRATTGSVSILDGDEVDPPTQLEGGGGEPLGGFDIGGGGALGGL